jgi:hypothetical protein
MKRLVFLSFVLGVLVTPIQAQAQSAPAGFNGLVFDSATQGSVTPQSSVAPKATKKMKTSTTHHVRKHHTRSAT